MEVWFLRHGLAGDRDEWPGDDALRPLTEEGKAQTAREAAGLGRLQLVPDLILSSPLVRARQTAEITARELGVAERLAIDERLSPGFRRKALLEILGEYAGRQRLMVVGHEPDFSKVVGKLIGGGEVVMKKGGVAVVELDSAESAEGRLLWLATPQLLEAAALAAASQAER